MTDEVPLSDEARQAGFGFASFVLVLSLIDKLLNTNRLSRQGAREVIDHALLNAETHQTQTPHIQRWFWRAGRRSGWL